MTAQPRSIEQAEDELLWWTAANLEFPGAYREQLAHAQQRLRFLQRIACLPEGTGLLSQDTIDRIMDLCAMPDIIPDLLSDLCGITLEWRPGARGGTAVCPFCGNANRKFGVSFVGGCRGWKTFKPGDFYCFVCTEGGSLKWLLMRQSGLGFREMMERLGQYAGVSLPAETSKREGMLL